METIWTVLWENKSESDPASIGGSFMTDFQSDWEVGSKFVGIRGRQFVITDLDINLNIVYAERVS